MVGMRLVLVGVKGMRRSVFGGNVLDWFVGDQLVLVERRWDWYWWESDRRMGLVLVGE